MIRRERRSGPQNERRNQAGIVTDLEGKPRFLDDLLTPDTGVGSEPVVDMGAFEVSHPMRVRRR